MSSFEQVLASMEASSSAPVAGRTLAARWSPKTAETYLSEVKMAREWWATDRAEAREKARRAGITGIPESSAGAFMPWDSDRLARYVTHLAQQGRAPRTINKALSALRAWHRLHGYPIPDGVAALTVLQEHERILTEAGWEPKRVEPITLDVAVRLLAACDRSRDRGKRDACLLMLGFAGMLPTERLSWLTLADVRLSQGEDDALPSLAIRRTPPAEEGHRPARPRKPRPVLDWVDVPHWRISGEHVAELCPVEAVADWIGVLLHHNQRPDSPVFRLIDRHGNIGGISPVAGGPTRMNEGGRLGTHELGAALRAAADRAGIPPETRPTMTSLRLGGVIRRRLEGATVDELEAASGLATLLDHIRAAERRAGR